MRPGLMMGLVLFVCCLATVAFPQRLTEPSIRVSPKASCPADSAKDVVQQLWDMAASGQMVTNWGSAAGLFSEAGPWPSNKTVRVFSDYWWVEYYECSDESRATVILQSHWDKIPGVIDPKLHFTPPPPSDVQAGVGYRLVFATPQLYYWGADGNPLPAKPLSYPKRWLIEGPPVPPFLTVTAAIRYVLEQRSKTSDPEIIKNADESLALLLKIH
jgi:hypothetical protein